jgi:hypothetical protein
MHQRQRALALVEVAEDLLAVLLLVADEVQQVVADLEGRAEVEAEPDQRSQVGLTARTHDGADPQRVDRGVPAHVLCMMS